MAKRRASELMASGSTNGGRTKKLFEKINTVVMVQGHAVFGKVCRKNRVEEERNRQEKRKKRDRKRILRK